MKSKLTQAIDIRDAALRWIERENLKNGEPEGDAEYEFRITTMGPSAYTTRVQVELPQRFAQVAQWSWRESSDGT